MDADRGRSSTFKLSGRRKGGGGGGRWFQKEVHGSARGQGMFTSFRKEIRNYYGVAPK